MTGNAHRLFGLAFGTTVGAAITPLHGGGAALALVVMSLPGSTAPDWMEIRLGPTTLIPHRTLTHWLLPWAGGAVAAGTWLGKAPVPAAALLGFVIGGLAHIAGDLGTPSGVPIWHPWKRYSLNLWDGGTSEFWPVLGAWLLAGISIRSFLL